MDDALLADQPKAYEALSRHFINAQAVPPTEANELAIEIIEALNESGFVVISKSFLDDLAAA